MNKEQIKAKIEQVVKGEKAFAEAAAEEKAKLQSELSALDKPELRHGNYGTTSYGDFCMTVLSHNAKGRTGPFRQVGSTYMYETDLSDCSTWKMETILGNIFDDLADRAEPLEQFKVERDFLNIFKAYINDDRIQIEVICGKQSTTVLFDLDQATEIAHNILREVATAKLKAAKT